MPPPTTVLEFAEETVATNVLAVTSAIARLGAAQAAQVVARAELAAQTSASKAKDAEIAAARIALADADTPAEAAVLAAALTGLIAEQRGIFVALLHARDASVTAGQEVSNASRALARVRARLSRAQSGVVVAATDDARKSALEATATAPPLDTIAADATDALTAEPYTEAATRVTDAIPPKLLEAARKGFEVKAAMHARSALSVRHAEDLLGAEMEATGGDAGLVDRRTTELARAERDLRDWTDGAHRRFNQAISFLTSVAAAELLNPMELAAVQALDDTPGQDAADLRIALLDARQAAHAAELDLAEATAAALAADPTADVSGVTEVSDARDALDAANADLTVAQSAYDAEQAHFTAWVLEVPDPAWRKVLAFIEADTILQELSGTTAGDVTTLIDGLTQAEENLAGALDEAEIHAVSVAFLDDFVTQGAGRLTRSSASHPERSFSAVRGDD